MTRKGQEQEQTDSEVGRQEGARLVRVACGGPSWGASGVLIWERLGRRRNASPRDPPTTDRQTDIQYTITDGLRSDQDAGPSWSCRPAASCERRAVCCLLVQV